MDTGASRTVTDLPDLAEVWALGETTCRAVVEAAPDAVVVLDETATIRLLNRRAATLFGYEPGDLVGQTVEVLVAEHATPAYQELRRSYCSGPRRTTVRTGVELTARRKDGSEMTAEVSFAGFDLDGAPWAAAAIRDAAARPASDLDVLSLLVEAQERERRRIADDIHDDSIQVLSAVLLGLNQLRGYVDSPRGREVVDRLEEDVDLATRRLRWLMFDLQPRTLETQGLVAALRSYLAALSRDSGTTYELAADEVDSDPPRQTKTILYRITQEALANARKHSQARHVRVAIEHAEGGFLTTITDDGLGIAPGARDAGAMHVGLEVMRERAEMAGGWFRADGSTGNGTTVMFWLPGTR